jgi:hypothetical protein
VTGDRSAAPAALVQALAQLDLNAVEIGLTHGLKNIGDLSPVTREFGAETWPVDEVADLLMEAVNNLFFGAKATSEDATFSDQAAFLEAASINRNPLFAASAMNRATELAEEAEARKVEEAEHVEA